MFIKLHLETQYWKSNNILSSLETFGNVIEIYKMEHFNGIFLQYFQKYEIFIFYQKYSMMLKL